MFATVFVPCSVRALQGCRQVRRNEVSILAWWEQSQRRAVDHKHCFEPLVSFQNSIGNL